MGALLDVDAPQVNADGLQAEGVGAGVPIGACTGPEVVVKILSALFTVTAPV